MNARLDVVEHQVAGTSWNNKQEKQDSKLSKSTKKNKACHKNITSRTVSSESSESSSNEVEIPSLSELRVSKKVQKQIDKKIAHKKNSARR